MMTITAQFALLAWIPFVLALFLLLPARRAMLVGFLGAWMFLPNTGFVLPGLPNYTKASAAAFAVFFGTALFDSGRLTGLRPRWLDLPMVIWCLCPFASSVTNGLGIYDGLSAMTEHIVRWGLPYYLGRIYLQRPEDLRQLALGLFVAGLIYAPLCLFEIRMSPKLGRWVYGFTGGGVAYASELGKWGSRPRVFMGDGLTLGLFMTAASLSGIWLWASGSLPRLGARAAGPWVAFVAVVSIGCKNMGALLLLVAGVAVLVAIKRYRTRAVAIALLICPPLYMYSRAVGAFSGASLVSMAGMVHEARAESLQFRLNNEDILVEKAMQQPVFGWGRWGRARVRELNWRGELVDVSVTDGLWVIALGNTGLVGLTSITLVLLLPAAMVIRRVPPQAWSEPKHAPLTLISVLLVLYTVDNLFNAMANPIYLVAVGGLVTVLTAPTFISVRTVNRENLNRSDHSAGRRCNPCHAGPRDPISSALPPACVMVDSGRNQI